MFSFFKPKFPTMSFSDGLSLCNSDDTILLLDVRTPDEYASGHIADSVNLPVQDIAKVSEVVISTNTKVFVYCKSGMRSKKACNAMVKMGYTDVTNIGGIQEWQGAIVVG